MNIICTVVIDKICDLPDGIVLIDAEIGILILAGKYRGGLSVIKGKATVFFHLHRTIITYMNGS